MKAQIAHALGLDISDGSLELADIHEQRNGLPSLTDHARIALPDHAIVHGHISDYEILAEAMHTLIRESSLEYRSTAIVTALPDAQVLTKIIPVPHNQEPLQFSTIEQSAHRIFRALDYRIKNPLLQWKYRELPSGTDGELTLFIARQESVEQWKTFFKHIGMRLAVMEMQSLALERSLMHKLHQDETIAIIDFGFRMTMVSIFDSSGLRFTHTIETGGYDITNELMRSLDCSATEAEQFKFTVGLTGKGPRDVHAALQTAAKDLLERIAAPFSDFGRPISKIIITGGGARLRGIRTTVEKALAIPVERGNFWLSPAHITKGHLASHTIDTSHILYYGGALGLALRGMNRYTLAQGINFLDAL